MLKLICKPCFFLFVLVLVLANNANPINPSGLSYAQTPETEYEALSPEYYYVPAPAPAPESEYEWILSPDYPSPPPYTESAPAPEPAEEDDFAPLEAAAAAPISMPERRPLSASDETGSRDQQAAPEHPHAAELLAPPPPADNAVSNSSVLSSNYSAEEEVNEYVQEQEASLARNKTAVVVVFGVVAGVCVAGIGGLVYKKRKDSKRTQYYEALAKKEGI